jgi:hypothetical protein
MSGDESFDFLTPDYADYADVDTCRARAALPRLAYNYLQEEAA